MFPWGTTSYPGMRIMNLYDSSHFTAAPTPVTTPVLITELKWRADNTAASWTGGTYPNCNGQFNFNTQALVDTAVSQSALAIGEVIYIQAWYRDTPNPGAANFSNGWGPIAIQ